jgi:hypothetical protein
VVNQLQGIKDLERTANMDNQEELLTISEAAKEYGVNIYTLEGRVFRGSMPSYRRGRHLYVTAADVVSWQPLWARDHEKIIREANAAGESDSAIGEFLGISRERVRQLRNRIGLTANPPQPRREKSQAPAHPKTLLAVFSE